MTVSKIYHYMTEKVVPESVMPQNLPVYLMGDEDTPAPELDAFTFLNRLRSLGIGSADFLYLLKGCNAPQAAIDKIEANPAMNLQSLIITLEGAGLGPQDYTRMLYTARQLWERTLTMRLDALDEEEDNSTQGAQSSEPEYIPEEEEDSEPEDIPEEEEDSEPEDIPEAEEAPEPEDIPEKEEAPEPSDIPEVEEAPESEDIPEEEEASEADNIHDIDDDDDVVRVDTGTSVMTQIDPSKYLIIPDDEDEEDTDDSGCEASSEEKKSGVAKGGIIAAACGAAVLFGTAFAIDYMGFEQIIEEEYIPHYAADATEIFAEVYNAYNSSADISAEVMRYDVLRSEVFGNMLISLPEELGVFECGEFIFSAAPDGITMYELTEDTAVQCGELLPPEGTQYIDVFSRDDGVTCLFAGENSCGITAYDGTGKQLYVSEQMGIPTDVYRNGDEISIATVYTPPFTESFTIDQTEHYLPVCSFNGEKQVIPADRISVSGRADGCSYAVLSTFSMEDGSLSKGYNSAALGRVVYSAAEEFAAVMHSDEGYYIVGDYSINESMFTECSLGEVTACDMSDVFVEQLLEGSAEDSGSAVTVKQHVFATAEKDENGTTIYLRGFDYKPVSALANIAEEVTSLRIDSGILYVSSENGVIMAADISEPFAPKLLELTAASGVIKGDMALCSSVGAAGLRSALYKRDENGVSECSSFTRSLTEYERQSFAMSGGNTLAIFSEDRCGVAYSFFDGVSYVTEFALFGKAKQQTTLFDEKSEFTVIHLTDEKMYLIYGDEVIVK